MKQASEALVETTTSTLEADLQTVQENSSLPFPEGVPEEYIGVNMPLVLDRSRYPRPLVCEHFTLDGNFKVKRDDASSNKALYELTKQLVCEHLTLDGNFRVKRDGR
ncbi:hypothetical protein K438DRAFT_1773960 [Mycena galopus ATCC 62051]|nr:hypothetical protein K438DRAFT_1773960 [Mycena galopus ATCC 62051]